MPSLKEFRNRIASVKATQKITKAMQMVAAAKLRRAQIKAEQARPYMRHLEDTIGKILQNCGDLINAHKFCKPSDNAKTYLLMVCTAERGLCGAFNSSIVRLAKERALALQKQGFSVKFFCVGKKGYDLLKRTYEKDIIEYVELRSVKVLSNINAEDLVAKLFAIYEKSTFDICEIFYSSFQTVISQTPCTQQILPVIVPKLTNQNLVDQDSQLFRNFGDDESAVLDYVLPLVVVGQIYRALIENAASEQGARMSAMDNATRNAGDMIRKQTLQYNRTRQAMITKELIEIISGAEAL